MDSMERIADNFNAWRRLRDGQEVVVKEGINFPHVVPVEFAVAKNVGKIKNLVERGGLTLEKAVELTHGREVAQSVRDLTDRTKTNGIFQRKIDVSAEKENTRGLVGIAKYITFELQFYQHQKANAPVPDRKDRVVERVIRATWFHPTIIDGRVFYAGVNLNDESRKPNGEVKKSESYTMSVKTSGGPDGQGVIIVCFGKLKQTVPLVTKADPDLEQRARLAGFSEFTDGYVLLPGLYTEATHYVVDFTGQPSKFIQPQIL